MRGIPIAQIERECVHGGESLIRRIGKIGDVDAIAACKQRQNIAALVVPRSRGQMCAEAGNHFEFGERRIAGEIFVWIDFDGGRVIDG